MGDKTGISWTEETRKPRGNRRVLIATERPRRNGGVHREVTVGMWVPARTMEVDYDLDGFDFDTPEARAEEDRYGINFWPEGWYSYPYGYESVCQRVETVTHWMPLPRLPEIQNGESQ